jgi:YfiH family protein
VILRAGKLAALGLLHGFSTRQGGVSRGAFSSLNLSRDVDDEPAAVEENRRRLARLGAFEPDRLVEMRQEHSDRVIVLPAGQEPPADARGDALIAFGRDAVLGIRTADCLAVLLADRRRRAVAAVHAGWRGTLAEVVRRAVEELARRGCDPGDLVAALGPCIRACCFTVGPEVAERFVREQDPGLARRDGEGRWHVDLAGANRRQLIRAGVPDAAIEDLSLCSACRAELFFSHRRDRGRTGRNLAFISLAPAGGPAGPAGI